MLFLFDYDGVIADSFDSLLAVCVEAQTVAVTWGFQARDLLVRESPDYLVDHPEEMLALPADICDAAKTDRIEWL